MAEALRRSKRECKPKKDKNFLYEEDFSAFSLEKNCVNNQQPDSDCSDSSSVNLNSVNCVRDNWKVQTAPAFSIIESLPLFNSVSEFNCEYVSSSSAVSVVVSQSQSQSQSQNTQQPSVKNKVQFSSVNVNNNSVVRRRISSSRFDFLDFNDFTDLEGNYLSCSSPATGTDMSGADSDGAYNLPTLCLVCGKGEAGNCSVCAKANNTEVPLAQAFMAAMKKMDTMSNQLCALGEVIVMQNETLAKQNDRLSKLEIKSGSESSSDQGQASSHKRSGKKKSKSNRVDDERERTHGVAMGTLRSRRSKKSDHEVQDEEPVELLLRDLTSTLPEKKRRRFTEKWPIF